MCAASRRTPHALFFCDSSSEDEWSLFLHGLRRKAVGMLKKANKQPCVSQEDRGVTIIRDSREQL